MVVEGVNDLGIFFDLFIIGVMLLVCVINCIGFWLCYFFEIKIIGVSLFVGLNVKFLFIVY